MNTKTDTIDQLARFIYEARADSDVPMIPWEEVSPEFVRTYRCLAQDVHDEPDAATNAEDLARVIRRSVDPAHKASDYHKASISKHANALIAAGIHQYI